MAFIEHRTSRSVIIPGPMDLFRVVKKWNRRRRKRAEIAVLLQQENWVLKDMGITRDDVLAALAQKGDPSLNLRAMAARRRFWTRRRDRF